MSGPWHKLRDFGSKTASLTLSTASDVVASARELLQQVLTGHQCGSIRTLWRDARNLITFRLDINDSTHGSNEY